MAGLATMQLRPSSNVDLRLAASNSGAATARSFTLRLTDKCRQNTPRPRNLSIAVRAEKEGKAASPEEKEKEKSNGAPAALLDKADGQGEEKEKTKEKKDKKDKKDKKEKVLTRTRSGSIIYLTDTEGDKTKGGGSGGQSGWGDGPITAKAHYPDDAAVHAAAAAKEGKDGKEGKKKKKEYEKELDKLKVELVKLQEWIRTQKLRVVVIFEGRDAAGKGGIIKTISEATNPRVVSIKALARPSDRERTQWYFQRYVAELPAGGEMVLFDRSWYNRAGVERVMGFCTDEEYKEFLRSCPEFERMLVRSGIILLKYWISVSPEEQERRFKERLSRPEKRWKLSEMDLESRARWSDYSQAKDIMFSYTDIKQAPWFVVPADDKKAARLNCIAHILSKIPYEDIIRPNDLKLPSLQDENYIRPPITDQTFVPQEY